MHVCHVGLAPAKHINYTMSVSVNDNIDFHYVFLETMPLLLIRKLILWVK